MNSIDMTIGDFTAELFSKASVPGGGGASAVCGALGSALCGMVINLTSGKKKFAEYEEDFTRILDSAAELKMRLIALADEDARVFAPLAQAYSISKDDPNRNAILEKALLDAAQVPLRIMRAAADGIALHAETADKCSAIMISDVGVGVLQCKAALLGAHLNVVVNTRLMSDKATASELNETAAELLRFTRIADTTYEKVLAALGQ